MRVKINLEMIMEISNNCETNDEALALITDEFENKLNFGSTSINSSDDLPSLVINAIKIKSFYRLSEVVL